MYIYEERQRKNCIQLDSHYEYVYQHLLPYKELEDAIASLSIAQGKKMLSGDTSSVMAYKSELAQLREQKKQLLRAHNLPEDYLTPSFHCDLCEDRGYLPSGQKCKCFKQLSISFLYNQSNIAQLLETDNFDNLSFDYFSGDVLTRYQENVNSSKNFITNFNSDYQNLLFYGTVGTGKSFLSGCIAKSLIDLGYSVIYFSASRYFDTISNYYYDYQKKNALSELFDDLYNCDLLIIDDLGTEVTSNFVTSQLFTCINERSIRKKSLLISTNLSFAEIQERYSDRVFSRITSNFKLNKFIGPDIRIDKATCKSRK